MKGRSYLYIGVADYDSVEKRFNEYKKKVERNLGKNTLKLRNLCLSVPELTGDEEADEEVIKRYSTKVTNLSNSIREAKRYLACWIPLEERKVVESFHRDDSDDLAILVEELKPEVSGSGRNTTRNTNKSKKEVLKTRCRNTLGLLFLDI